MSVHFSNRLAILKSLQQELVGPSSAGTERDFSHPLSFEKATESYGPWRQKDNGEEVIQRDSPTKRYGIGVLYPLGSLIEDRPEDSGSAAAGFISQNELDSSANLLTASAMQSIEQARKNIENVGTDEGQSDLDLSHSNAYRQSSKGVSFLVELPEAAILIVEASGGRYRPVEVLVEKRNPVTWWLRSPVKMAWAFSAKDICTVGSARIKESSRIVEENIEDLNLQIEVYSRPNPYGTNPQQRLLTVCLVNRSDRNGGKEDSFCLFQSHFEVSVISPEKCNLILPYPDPPIRIEDEEELSLELLYRDFEVYAVGHGCAANWDSKDQFGRVSKIIAESLPVFETPSITPDIKDKSGNPIQVAMAPLAGLVPDNNGFSSLSRVVELYEQWIKEKEERIPHLDKRFESIAEKHLWACKRCVERMRNGLHYLLTNPVALKAFKLANHAILLQQLHSRRETREANYNGKTKRIEFSEPFQELDITKVQAGRGQWRAFQVAFLLMSLRSASEADTPDRATVELIWFPTGGGKTEAYLGLTAFAAFMRRLKKPKDSGVNVLMRYTLRLLTAQQFQRASGLVCAMEYIRKTRATELGSASFSIGIWVGGDNTPNKRADAIALFNKLANGDKFAENQFILNRCPWCGAQMGPLKQQKGTSKEAPKVIGYHHVGKTIVFKCPDSICAFAQGFPIYVIDEDIYEFKPTIVIGTVDKFAMLTWRPEARSLFGLDENGNRLSSPPGLIIQDELHLIAGPLGSVVGLYEAVIEELCTDRRFEPAVPPKIVSSTATIRRYSEQIKALYGRQDVVLFPPPGLEADDSFFAKYARNEMGELQPGRMYVGVHAPGLGSLQTTQVRTFTSLLQGGASLASQAERDPWWTLLIFFNSLRELGTTLSLFQSDIPDYMKVFANRMGIGFANIRNLWQIKELTGRLRSDEVPDAITDMEVSCTTASEKKPVDVCLASNILEVGVDIDRLSLMSVVGQPKTTSQYIQVTGRIGRRWWERPGLVVTIYAASKPRDRSHFEKFRSYHERLYAQVEPVSVTPFSPPVLDRALHAIMALYVRQVGNSFNASSPYPYPEELLDNLKRILLSRVKAIDPVETANFERVFERRAKEWQRWKRTKWDSISFTEDAALLRLAGAYVRPEHKHLSWPTPMSMRNVDAECQAEITTLYLLEESEG